jgi:hypothetical protein
MAIREPRFFHSLAPGGRPVVEIMVRPGGRKERRRQMRAGAAAATWPSAQFDLREDRPYR